MPEEGRWAELAACWRAVVERFLNPGSDETAPAVARAVDQAFAGLAAMEAITPTVSLDTFAQALRNSLERATVPLAEGVVPGVQVLDAGAARGVPFRALFLMGMNEGVFPRTIREDPFLRDHARAVLEKDLGYKISPKLAGYGEEKLLFALLTGSVSDRLHCSYQRSDAAERPLAPSWYLREADPAREEAGTPIPKSVLGKRQAPPFDDHRWLLPEELAVRRAVEGADPTPFVRMGGASVEGFHRSAAAGRAQDDGAGTAGPFDGITGPLEDVWNGILENAVSPTTLEAYGRCPFQYFARGVLKLERLERPETAAPVQALEWGQLCHEILQRFYQDPGRAWGDGWSAWLDSAAAEVLSAFEARYATGYPAAWEVAGEELVGVLREAVRADLDEMKLSGFRPVELESYLTTRLGEEWPGDLRDLPVHGRLDRIDHHAGDGRYRVVDYKYKTGRGPGNGEDKPEAAAMDGRKLQLPVYVLLAAEYARTRDPHGGRRRQRGLVRRRGLVLLYRPPLEQRASGPALFPGGSLGRSFRRKDPRRGRPAPAGHPRRGVLRHARNPLPLLRGVGDLPQGPFPLPHAGRETPGPGSRSLMTHSPPDDLERRQATTTFDRNVVVTAGAGTGKTTLLVERCVNLLMRERRPVKVTDLVALTFTNKAANEMKARLREELEVLAGPHAGRPAAALAAARVDAIRERYRLTADEIHGRAREALQDLERAQIGTIHSFAASLLRLYPLEAGLDPGFQEDDGTLRKRRFDTLWGLWLSEELSDTGPRKTPWKHALDRFPLDVLRELALALCAEHVDLDELGLAGAPDGAIVEWLRGLDEAATDLIERYPGNRKIERALAAARKAIRSVLTDGPTFDAAESGLLKAPSRVSGWTDHDFNLARNLIADAAGLAQVDAAEVGRLCALLAPFVQQCRREFTRTGLVTFDGLLVRTRDLLHEHPRIREELKARFKAILVDEFQDTDPLQYEILLWLCEEPSQGARNWREIRLVPGKLFVVGDPKQSIYGFRGADMEAYLNVVKEVIEAQDGVQYRLTANFRSDPRILDVVNGVCERLIQERPGLQPEYIALEPGLADNGRKPASGEPGGASAEQDRKPVTVRRVTPLGATLKAEGARRLEAESLARWLKEDVLGRAFFHDREGRRVAVEPGHVAFLMRALTNVQVYLEALRRQGIRYVVEGERDFYAAQEVIDAVNLLRAIDNPHDRLALVGVLRSPAGGHDDAAIFDLHRQGLLDYRSAADSRWVDLPGGVVDLYQRLHRLHREARFLEAGKAVERVFKELPLSVLAAGGRSGQQAVANLEKVRLLAREAGAGGSGTLKDVVAELERRVRDREDESENALEEETLDAVRIMSIHRAKGLEFPVVVLVDALSGVRGGSSSPVEVRRDWASGLTGIHVDEVWSLPGVFLRAKRREREAYEQRRLLYVAMTRPRQRLVVSFADRQGNDGDSLAGLIGEAAGGSLRGADRSAVACGDGEMAVEVLAETPAPTNRATPGRHRLRTPRTGRGTKRNGAAAARSMIPVAKPRSSSPPRGSRPPARRRRRLFAPSASNATPPSNWEGWPTRCSNSGTSTPAGSRKTSMTPSPATCPSCRRRKGKRCCGRSRPCGRPWRVPPCTRN